MRRFQSFKSKMTAAVQLQDTYNLVAIQERIEKLPVLLTKPRNAIASSATQV